MRVEGKRKSLGGPGSNGGDMKVEPNSAVPDKALVKESGS